MKEVWLQCYHSLSQGAVVIDRLDSVTDGNGIVIQDIFSIKCGYLIAVNLILATPVYELAGQGRTDGFLEYLKGCS